MSSTGISPHRLLFFILRTFKWLSPLISGGMIPLSWLYCRYNLVTCPFLHCIPCQLQGVFVTSQPLLFFHCEPLVLLYTAIRALHSAVGIWVTLPQSVCAGKLGDSKASPNSHGKYVFFNIEICPIIFMYC
jgi:hypothetical protein